MFLYTFFCQIDSLKIKKEDLELSSEEGISVMELLFQGGLAGQVIIFILFILSIITVYIFFER